MKTVYICSPYRADNPTQFELQLAYTKRKAREQVLLGNNVIVPHLYYPQFLDDNNEEERTLGMASAIDLMRVCDMVLVCIGYGISNGMIREINVAEEHNLSIVEVI